MTDHIIIGEKSRCFGCCACLSICPQGAVEMVKDEEGFIYPIVKEEICVGCCLCIKVCPSLSR